MFFFEYLRDLLEFPLEVRSHIMLVARKYYTLFADRVRPLLFSLI